MREERKGVVGEEIREGREREGRKKKGREGRRREGRREGKRGKGKEWGREKRCVVLG